MRGAIDRLLRAVLPEGPAADAIRGDLREEHGRRRAAGEWAALGWYGLQAVTVAWWSVVDRLRGRPWVGGDLVRSAPPPRRRGATGDLADGLRLLRRSPGYSAAVIVTLGLALATTATVFTLVRGVLLREQPYPEPDSLVRIDRMYDGEVGSGSISYPDLMDWRERIGTLDGIAAHTGYEGLYVTDGIAEIWRGAAVTGNLADVLRVLPALGPGFDAETGATGSHSIILSHDLWLRRFNADRSVVGRSVAFDGETWQVVGVLPEDWAYPSPGTDFLIPIPANRLVESRASGYLHTVARLASGVSLQAARAEVDAVVGAIDREYGEWLEGVVVRRYSDVAVAPVRRVLLIFMGSVLLVLLVACANVAGLTLARTESRRIELAIRGSIGASRGRLVRQLLVESVTLSLAGGILGILGALAGVRGLLAAAPADLPRRESVWIDPTVLAFTSAVAVAAGILFGLLPAIRGARAGTTAGLRVSATGTREGRRTRELLAAAQIAVAVVLMFGAGLLLRSFASLTSVDPGFRTRGVFVAEIGLDPRRYAQPAAIQAFHDALFERVRAMPGATAVGLNTHLPFTPAGISVTVLRENEVFVRGQADEMKLEVFNGEYFGTLEIPVLRGRLPSDLGDGREVSVNMAAARMMWPGEDPIGKRFSFDFEEGSVPADSTLFTVVGILPDLNKETLDEVRPATAYFSLPGFSRHYTFISGRYFYLTVATEGDPAALLDPVRAAINTLDPALPLRMVDTMDGLVRATTVSARFRTFALGTFALLAIAVAFVGIYGVMAYGVSRGLREIGVRMALGAAPADVRGRVVLRAGTVVLIGGLAGLAGALLAGPVLAGVLFRVPARDPITLAGVLALAAGGSLLAAWLPAVRASRVDPMNVLKRE